MDTKKNASILLVEDEAIIAFKERLELEEHGYRVTHCLRGEDAVARFRAEPDAYDLVLMDIDLGRGMDGPEAARRILEARDVPLVFLSSHTERDVVARTEEITSYGYVVKNCGITVLAASIRMAFRLHDEIVERRRVEAAYRHSEAMFRALSEDSLIGVYVIDGGRISYANPALAAMFGARIEDLIGRSPLDFAHPEERARLETAMRERLSGGGSASGYRVRGFKLDGREFSAEIFGSSAEVEGRRLVIGNMLDASSRASTERALEDALAERETVLRELHHRVKNSLGTAESLIALERDRVRDDAARKALSDAELRLHAISALYDRLDRFARVDAIDVGAYLRGIVDMISTAYLRGDGKVRVRALIEDAELPSRAAMPLGLIANELVTNALKYAFPEGRSGLVSVSLAGSGEGYELVVADDGIGCSPCGEARGSGLGLELVRMLAAQLGGGVGFDCERGFRATVRFPIRA